METDPRSLHPRLPGDSAKQEKIEKTLIIETKGGHLAHGFSDIRQFMENTFIDLNDNAFDFLYLEDGQDMSYHLQSITDKINHYFGSDTM